MQKFILGIFLLSAVGSCAELFLLEHTEGVWQWIPITLILASFLLLTWMGISKSSISIRAFQLFMGLFVISGFIGLFMHFQGNMEFELELYPNMKGVELFWNTLKGATPVLAPGQMIAMGLLGWVYTKF